MDEGGAYLIVQILIQMNPAFFRVLGQEFFLESRKMYFPPRPSVPCKNHMQKNSHLHEQKSFISPQVIEAPSSSITRTLEVGQEQPPASQDPVMGGDQTESEDGRSGADCGAFTASGRSSSMVSTSVGSPSPVRRPNRLPSDMSEWEREESDLSPMRVQLQEGRQSANVPSISIGRHRMVLRKIPSGEKFDFEDEDHITSTWSGPPPLADIPVFPAELGGVAGEKVGVACVGVANADAPQELHLSSQKIVATGKHSEGTGPAFGLEEFLTEIPGDVPSTPPSMAGKKGNKGTGTPDKTTRSDRRVSFDRGKGKATTAPSRYGYNFPSARYFPRTQHAEKSTVHSISPLQSLDKTQDDAATARTLRKLLECLRQGFVELQERAPPSSPYASGEQGGGITELFYDIYSKCVDEDVHSEYDKEWPTGKQGVADAERDFEGVASFFPSFLPGARGEHASGGSVESRPFLDEVRTPSKAKKTHSRAEKPLAAGVSQRPLTGTSIRGAGPGIHQGTACSRSLRMRTDHLKDKSAITPSRTPGGAGEARSCPGRERLASPRRRPVDDPPANRGASLLTGREIPGQRFSRNTGSVDETEPATPRKISHSHILAIRCNLPTCASEATEWRYGYGGGCRWNQGLEACACLRG